MQRILDIYARMFEFDIEVLSQPWMYWTLLIPATLYSLFMLAKWYVITAPLWLPVYVALRAFVEKK